MLECYFNIAVILSLIPTRYTRYVHNLTESNDVLHCMGIYFQNLTHIVITEAGKYFSKFGAH